MLDSRDNKQAHNNRMQSDFGKLRLPQPLMRSVRAIHMICPHCQKEGVTFLSKSISSTAIPARCKQCGKASSISGLALGASGGVFHLVFFGAAIASFFYWSWWPLFLAIVIFIVFDLCLTKWAPLKPMTESQVKDARLSSYVFIGIFILLVIFAGFSGE